MATSATATDLRQLGQALAALGRARLANPVASGTGKAFELWLTMRIAARWKRRGWRVELRDADGHPVAAGGDFVARGAPGQIARRRGARAMARRPRPDGAGFVFVDMNRRGPSTPEAQFELHGWLQFVGRGAPHECDLSLIPHDLGDLIRRRQRREKASGAPIGLPPMAIECKRHAGDGPVGETREAVARLFDLTRIPICGPMRVGQIF